MSSLAGDLNPGMAGYLAQMENMDLQAFHHMIHFESGLLGLSGTSSDMQELLDSEQGDPRAAEAIAVFCYRVKQCIDAYAATQGGLDTLIFTAGIGENAPAVRARICEGLDFIGLRIVTRRNATGEAVISLPEARVTVRMMPTDEELMIARGVLQCCPQLPVTVDASQRADSGPVPIKSLSDWLFRAPEPACATAL